jgi:membrane peptidoglycan carboxypeptidase
VLATFSEQNRVNVNLSQVPRVVIDAVVSTEDRHFFSEGAVNPVSMVRALSADLTGSGSLQGGSTITQQYVKQAYLNSKRTLSRKIKEAALAIKLAHKESKDQILQNYLNII